MIQIIKDKSELRKGNLILIDDLVFPPNFITAQPQILGEGFEEHINKDFDNCAFLNLKDEHIKELFPTGEKNGFAISKIADPKINELPKWKITHGDNFKEISFVHQLQNFYFDWTNENLLPNYL